jgi:hypothetical protein
MRSLQLLRYLLYRASFWERDALFHAPATVKPRRTNIRISCFPVRQTRPGVPVRTSIPLAAAAVSGQYTTGSVGRAHQNEVNCQETPHLPLSPHGTSEVNTDAVPACIGISAASEPQPSVASLPPPPLQRQTPLLLPRGLDDDGPVSFLMERPSGSQALRAIHPDPALTTSGSQDLELLCPEGLVAANPALQQSNLSSKLDSLAEVGSVKLEEPDLKHPHSNQQIEKDGKLKERGERAVAAGQSSEAEIKADDADAYPAAVGTQWQRARVPLDFGRPVDQPAADWDPYGEAGSGVAREGRLRALFHLSLARTIAPLSLDLPQPACFAVSEDTSVRECIRMARGRPQGALALVDGNGMMTGTCSWRALAPWFSCLAQVVPPASTGTDPRVHGEAVQLLREALDQPVREVMAHEVSRVPKHPSPWQPPCISMDSSVLFVLDTVVRLRATWLWQYDANGSLVSGLTLGTILRALMPDEHELAHRSVADRFHLGPSIVRHLDPLLAPPWPGPLDSVLPQKKKISPCVTM